MPYHIDHMQVHVYVGGQLSACSGGTELYAELETYPGACSYIYSPLATPTVFNISPLQAATGDNITIIGSGFSSEDITVNFEDTPCFVGTWSTDEIVCILGEGIAGTKPLHLNNLNGSADVDNITLQQIISVNSISPPEGSNAGGTVITIIGSGFYPQAGFHGTNLQTICSDWENIVTIDSSQCDVIISTYTSITCKTPAATTAADSETDISITVRCISNPTLTTNLVIINGFTFSSQQTPTVASVDPSEGSSAGGDTITIYGNHFSSIKEKVVVTVSHIYRHILTSQCGII